MTTNFGVTCIVIITRGGNIPCRHRAEAESRSERDLISKESFRIGALWSALVRSQHSMRDRSVASAQKENSLRMGPLLDRTEFRKVVKEVVKCLHAHLDRPELSPLTPEQIMFWMQNVTLEDLQIVTDEIETEGSGGIH